MLTQAAPGSLRKTPYEAAAAPAFPHSRFTTPSPAGLPGALLCSTEVVVPHRQQPHLLVLAWPRAAERTTVQELFVRAVALGLGGAGWLAAGRAGRLGLGLAPAVGRKGRRPVLPRCSEELHGFSSSHGHLAPALPPAATLAAGTAQTHQPHCAPRRAEGLSGCAGGIRHRNLSDAGRFPQLSELRVTLSPRCPSRGRLRSSPARNTPCHSGWAAARNGRACRVPAPFRRGRGRQASRTQASRTRASSRALSRRCAVPPPSDGRSAAASP